jgi:hypothetical protein
MNSNRLILIEEITIEKIDDKFWAVVYFNDNTKWVPALIEQALLAQKVAQCERMKYLNLRWDPALLPMEFLQRAIKGECVCALAYEKKFNLQHTRAYKKFCLEKKDNHNAGRSDAQESNSRI